MKSFNLVNIIINFIFLQHNYKLRLYNLFSNSAIISFAISLVCECLSHPDTKIVINSVEFSLYKRNKFFHPLRVPVFNPLTWGLNSGLSFLKNEFVVLNIFLLLILVWGFAVISKISLFLIIRYLRNLFRSFILIFSLLIPVGSKMFNLIPNRSE